MHIIFDVGRVLCQVDLDIFTKTFEHIIGPRVNFVFDGMDFLSSIQHVQDCGKTNVELSLMDLTHTLSPPLYQDEIKSINQAWINTITPYDKMIELKNWCLEQGHKVAILSNMGYEHKTYIFENYPEVFGGCTTFFSCDIKYRKPSKFFFYLFLKQYPEFKNALYFDDLPENLETGQGFGLKPYLINIEKIYMTARNQNEAEELVDVQIRNAKKYYINR